MSKNILALLGGDKAVTKDFPIYNAMGTAEVDAATEVIKSGVLSGFLGGWGDKFNGGKNVQSFEKERTLMKTLGTVRCPVTTASSSCRSAPSSRSSSSTAS